MSNTNAAVEAVREQFIATGGKPVIAREMAEAMGITESAARKMIKICMSHPDFVMKDRTIDVYSQNYRNMHIGKRCVLGIAMTDTAMCRMIREMRDNG